MQGLSEELMFPNRRDAALLVTALAVAALLAVSFVVVLRVEGLGTGPPAGFALFLLIGVLLAAVTTYTRWQIDRRLVTAGVIPPRNERGVRNRRDWQIGLWPVLSAACRRAGIDPRWYVGLQVACGVAIVAMLFA